MKKISCLQQKHNFSYSYALQLLKQHRIAGHLLDPEVAIVKAKALQEEDRKARDLARSESEERERKQTELITREKADLAKRDTEWKMILDQEGEDALLCHVERWCIADNGLKGGFNAVCEAKYQADRLIEEFKERLDHRVVVDFRIDCDNVIGSSKDDYIGDLRFDVEGVVSNSETRLEIEVDDDALEMLGCNKYLRFDSVKVFEETVRSWPLQYYSTSADDYVKIGDALVNKLKEVLTSADNED